MHLLFCVTFLFLTETQAKAFLKVTTVRTLESINEEKDKLFALEDQEIVGAGITLNANEKKANDILMSWKHKELDAAFNSPRYFNLSKHYFHYQNQIKKSRVYQIIKKMPKGGALHIHNSFMLNIEDLLAFTRDPTLYVCFSLETFYLRFSNSVPYDACPSEWRRINDVRESYTNVVDFEDSFSQFFTLNLREPDELVEDDINSVWDDFNNIYRNVKKLITYRPVREKYIYQSLKRFYDDNVLYAELRSGLHSVHEIDGSWHDEKYAIEMYQRVVEEFKKDHPDFIGVKLILTAHRRGSIPDVGKALNLTRTMKMEYPDMIVGFDLIGQEDKGWPLARFLPILSEAKKDIDYYFHAGETNWNGMASDENLFDAIALDSKRIGHAYGLVKHPSAIQAIVDKDIAIEANVISNNVLGLVKDIRNHPLATYLALGLPVVLSSDDPGAWGAEPLTTDFFVTFMGIANRDADLRLLKQLALNSIKYSSLCDSCKLDFKNVFTKRWNKFIEYVITTEID